MSNSELNIKNMIHYRKDWYNPVAWFYNLKELSRAFKYSFQRVFHGCAECDIWNMDYYLCNLISYMLDELKDKHYGYYEILSDNECTEDMKKQYPEENKNKTIVSDKELNNRWENYLSYTSMLFKQAKDFIDFYKYEEAHGITNKAFDELKKYYWALWD